MTTPTLLPCPLCGGVVKLSGGPLAQESCSIDCMCGLNIGHSDKNILIELWNTRHKDPAIQKKLELLAKYRLSNDGQSLPLQDNVNSYDIAKEIIKDT